MNWWDFLLLFCCSMIFYFQPQHSVNSSTKFDSFAVCHSLQQNYFHLSSEIKLKNVHTAILKWLAYCFMASSVFVESRFSIFFIIFHWNHSALSQKRALNVNQIQFHFLDLKLKPQNDNKIFHFKWVDGMYSTRNSLTFSTRQVTNPTLIKKL